MAYKEVKLDKNGAKAFLGGLNDNIMPKEFKGKKKEPKQMKSEPGSKKRKIH